MDYESALKTLKNRETKKVGNNTYLVRGENEVGVRLHSTIVVTIHADGTYTLNSGGWRTVTTKARMNEFCPVRVSQKNYDWFVGGEPFYDGIRVRVVNGVELAGV